MTNYRLHLMICLLLVCFANSSQAVKPADQPPESKSANTRKPVAGWTNEFTIFSDHQFGADIKNTDSDFSHTRYGLKYSGQYQWNPVASLGFTVGTSLDDYHWSSNRAAGWPNPWERVYTTEISTPFRWPISRKWGLFIAPTVGVAAESGADWGKAWWGGVVGGAIYRWTDRFMIGPGLGVSSQIEDDVSVFPIVLLRWKITERFTLQTGGSSGTAIGPGLSLAYTPSDSWEWNLGVGVDELRFSLDKNHPIAPSGVGEDWAVPVYLNMVYRYQQFLQAGLLAGVKLGGELKLEDQHGRRIGREKYDPAPFVGLNLALRF